MCDDYKLNLDEITRRMKIPPDSTIKCMLREEVKPYLPKEIWDLVDEYAYNRPYSRKQNLEDFKYRRSTQWRFPMVRCIEDNDYDEVRELLSNATGSMRFPLLSILQRANKPWMIHLLLDNRTYPNRVYCRALLAYAEKGMADMVMEMMSVYRKMITHQTVFLAMGELVAAGYQQHTKIQQVLADVLQIPLQHLMKTIVWFNDVDGTLARVYQE